MAASGEVCKCGRMLTKFKILHNKLKMDSQIRSKRYLRRVPFNPVTEANCETSEYRSMQSKAVNGSLASERDTNENVGDFFGIESDFGVKEIKETSAVSPVEKYSYLLCKKPAADEEPVVEEKVLLTSFGSVRLDVDNHVKIHGQHDKVFVERMSLLQPEKHLFGKRQRADGRNRDLYNSSNSLQHEELIDINESEPTRFFNGRSLTPSISDKSELTNQKDVNNFVRNFECRIENPYDAKHNIHCGTVDQNSNIQPVAGIADKSSYVDETYINQLEKTDIEQSVENSDVKYNIYPCTANEQNSKIQAAATATNDKNNFIDEHYFSQLEKTNIEQNIENSNDKCNIHPGTANDQNSRPSIQTTAIATDHKNRPNYVDEQYFSQLEKQNDKCILNQNNANENSNFIEHQYFDKNVDNLYDGSNNDLNSHLYPNTIYPSGAQFSQTSVPLQNAEKSYSMNTPQSELLEEEIPENGNEINQNSKYGTSQETGKSATQSDDEHYGFSTAQEKRLYVKPNIEHPQTAYDYVMKLRKEGTQINEEKSSTATGKKVSLGKEKLDSKGFLILKTQVQDFRYLNQDAIVTILKNSILYNDNNIVALSKPYGLVCQGGNTKLTGIDIQTCLPDLAKRIFRNSVDTKLYLVHSIEKETTGILVLARTEKMSTLLTDLFSKNQIKKIYWALTRGVPDISEGIIDIPIAEGTVDQKRRMALRPDDDEIKHLSKPSKKAERAITHYNIISTQGNAALIEMKPETNIKHQIRIHLGFGLRCPILGDHKYSNLNKIAPQKLPEDMLRRLSIQQSKVRYVPMHLHLKSLVIPEILDGKNLFFHANLPYHFKTNLNRLKFKKS